MCVWRLASFLVGPLAHFGAGLPWRIHLAQARCGIVGSPIPWPRFLCTWLFFLRSVQHWSSRFRGQVASRRLVYAVLTSLGGRYPRRCGCFLIPCRRCLRLLHAVSILCSTRFLARFLPSNSSAILSRRVLACRLPTHVRLPQAGYSVIFRRTSVASSKVSGHRLHPRCFSCL